MSEHEEEVKHVGHHHHHAHRHHDWKRFAREAIQSKRYLIFSGGGVHGISHIGFISFVKHILGGGGGGGDGQSSSVNFNGHFKGFAGTSIGAFIAMLLACNETNVSQLFCWITNPNFIAQILQSLDLHRAWRSYGAVPNDVGTSYIDFILRHYFPSSARMTFQQLYDLTQKELCVVTVNVSTAQAEYHSHRTTPHFVVADSVYASMCVPFLCQPMRINDQYYFDGGILDNFPIVHCGFPRDECLGSYLQTEMGVTFSQPPTVKSWMKFVFEMVYMMCRPTSNVYFPRLNPAHFVTIPQSKTIHFLKVYATSSELYRLYLRGIYYTRRHFQLEFVRSLLRPLLSQST